jgi:hypothetical protein
MLTPALHRLADYLQTDICRKQVAATERLYGPAPTTMTSTIDIKVGFLA